MKVQRSETFNRIWTIVKLIANSHGQYNFNIVIRQLVAKNMIQVKTMCALLVLTTK